MHIQFAELPVFDQDRAKAFYTGHLACQVSADQLMGDTGWRWIELTFPGAVTNLHFVKRPDDTPGTEPVLVLVDGDVEATVAGLKARGVESSPSRRKRLGSRAARSPNSATARATSWL
ncbi:glyoxalase [Mesorhizobium sp. M0999]|uniref:VOC family protein n=1 Tax=Mesorhizobium sp. M0999 TaxID=2957045 RepID=UPI0033392B63